MSLGCFMVDGVVGLPLDPYPFVDRSGPESGSIRFAYCDENGLFRWRSQDHEYWCDFEPRDGFEQDEALYPNYR